MKGFKAAICAGLLALFLGTTTHAAQTNYAIGESGGSELKLGLGPRAVAMGEAFVGLANDVNALAWNPAGLAQLKCYQLGLVHDIYVQDIALEYAAFAGQLFKGAGLGMNVLYIDYGEVDKTEEVGGLPVISGTFRPWALSASVGYGQWLLPELAVGAAFKFFHQNLDNATYTPIAFDIGVLLRPGVEGLQLGMNLQNLGTALGDAALASNLKLGAAYLLPIAINQGDAWRVLLDGNLPLGDTNYTSVHLGTEYQHNQMLALRVGYKLSDKGELGDITGLTAGLGFGLAMSETLKLSVDYALLVLGELGDSHQIGLTVGWGCDARKLTEQGTAEEIARQQAEAKRLAELQRLQLLQQQALQKELDELKKRIGIGEFKPIAFTSGSSDLLPGSYPVLDYLGNILVKYPELKVRIEGHTDSQGEDEDNLRLSQARVEATQVYLVNKFKINPEHLLPVGYGEARPIADNATAEGMAKNRRVEFYVISAEEKK